MFLCSLMGLLKKELGASDLTHLILVPHICISQQLFRWRYCRLFGAKPLSKPMLVIVHWTLRNKFQWHFNQNTKRFVRENAFQKYRLWNGNHFVQGEGGGELKPHAVHATALLWGWSIYEFEYFNFSHKVSFYRFSHGDKKKHCASVGRSAYSFHVFFCVITSVVAKRDIITEDYSKRLMGCHQMYNLYV